MLRDGLRRSAHRVRDLFDRLDADGNKSLDKAEFRSALALLGWEGGDHAHLIDEVKAILLVTSPLLPVLLLRPTSHLCFTSPLFLSVLA